MSHSPAFTDAIQRGLGARVRVLLDAEGFPFVPARYGRIEWRGPEWNGAARLYAYTDHSQIISRLRQIPGMSPKQIGDKEAVFSLPAEDQTALTALGAVLKPRQRRVLTPEQRARLARTAFRPHVQDDFSDQEGAP